MALAPAHPALFPHLRDRCASSSASSDQLAFLREWAATGVNIAAGDDRNITHLPYRHADGSFGWRGIDGEGFGFGEDPMGNSSTKNRWNTRFSLYEHVVPRLRWLGLDPQVRLNQKY